MLVVFTFAELFLNRLHLLAEEVFLLGFLAVDADFLRDVLVHFRHRLRGGKDGKELL